MPKVSVVNSVCPENKLRIVNLWFDPDTEEYVCITEDQKERRFKPKKPK